MRSVPDNLAPYARKASQAYLAGTSPNLTDAVKSSVQDSDLSAQQVRLVTHAANRFTWKSVFANSDDKTVQFDPADPNQVLEDTGMDTSSHVHLPPGPALAPPPPPTDRLPLYAGPGVSEQLALQSANTSMVDVHDQAKVAHVHAVGDVGRLRLQLTDNLEKFAHAVRDGLFNRELSLNDVLVAVASLAPAKLGRVLAKSAAEVCDDFGFCRGELGMVPDHFEVDSSHPVASSIEACMAALDDYNYASSTVELTDKLAKAAFKRMGG